MGGVVSLFVGEGHWQELEDVSFFLDRVFDFRLENHLEEPAVSITGFFPLPDISDCDGFGENMAMDLYEKIQAADADNLKFFQQEAFLIEVIADVYSVQSWLKSGLGAVGLHQHRRHLQREGWGGPADTAGTWR